MALLICSCRLGGFDKINIAENALNLNCIKDKALCSFCFIGYDFWGFEMPFVWHRDEKQQNFVCITRWRRRAYTFR